MECIYYAVLTESLNVIQINFVFKGFILNPQKPSVTKIQFLGVKGNTIYSRKKSTAEYSAVQYTTKEWTLQWPLTLTVPHHLCTPLLKNSAVPHFGKSAAPC
jgi:hypothetical protein